MYIVFNNISKRKRRFHVYIFNTLLYWISEWVSYIQHNALEVVSWYICSISVVCLVTKSYLALCNPMDCSPPGSSVHEIFQARILEWSAISYSRGSSQPRERTQISCISCIGRQVLCHWRHLGSPINILHNHSVCIKILAYF